MRYVLHPGPVISRADGQEHIINAPQLARLYGVNFRECVVVYDDEEHRDGYREQPGDVHLYPRYDGNYDLPRDGDNER